MSGLLPSTTNAVPFPSLARSETRKHTASVMSSPVPTRPDGMVLMSWLRTASADVLYALYGRLCHHSL
jgi:hypothetical protein